MDPSSPTRLPSPTQFTTNPPFPSQPLHTPNNKEDGDASPRLPTNPTPPKTSSPTRSTQSKLAMKNRLKATYSSSSPNASRLLHSSRSYNSNARSNINNNKNDGDDGSSVPNPQPNPNNTVDLRELLSLPPSDLASNVSSILTSNEALRRNLYHLTNRGEKDKVTIKDLERRCDALKNQVERRKSKETTKGVTAIAAVVDLGEKKKETEDNKVGESNSNSNNSNNSKPNNNLDDELLTVLKRTLADTNSKCTILTKNNKLLHSTVKAANKEKETAVESLVETEKNLKLKETEMGMLKMGLERERKLKDMAVNDHNMYKERVDNITTNNEYLRKMLEEARGEHFQYKDAKERERNKFNARIEDYERILTEAKEAIDNLTTEKQQADHRVINLEDAMASLKSSKNDLESRLNQVKEEYEVLRQSSEKHKKEGEEHKEGYEKEKKSRQSSIIKLAEQMQRVSASQEEAKQWEVQVRQLYEVIGKLNGEKEGMKKKIERLERRLESKVRASSDATVNALQDARKGGEEAAGILMKEKERLEKDLREEKEERARVEGEGERHYKEWEALKERLRVMEREKDTAEGLAKTERGAFERTLKEKDKEIARLGKRLGGVEGKLQELLRENMVEKKEELLAEVARIGAEMGILKLANDGLTAEVGQLNEEGRRMNDEVVEAVGEGRRLKELVYEKEGEVETAKKIGKKWEESCVTVKEKMAKVLQVVVGGMDEGKSVEQVLYDVKFVMLGEDD